VSDFRTKSNFAALLRALCTAEAMEMIALSVNFVAIVFKAGVGVSAIGQAFGLRSRQSGTWTWLGPWRAGPLIPFRRRCGLLIIARTGKKLPSAYSLWNESLTEYYSKNDTVRCSIFATWSGAAFYYSSENWSGVIVNLQRSAPARTPHTLHPN
jgi:hypothetical protein